MTNNQKIRDLRRAGSTLSAIPDLTDSTISAVKSYCSRNRIRSVVYQECLYCEKPLNQLPGRIRAKYCHRKCKDDWWNRHHKKMKHRETNY